MSAILHHSWFGPALVLWAYMSLVYLIALLRRDNGLADIAWGLGFVVLGIAAWGAAGRIGLRGALLLGLVCLWAFRLAIYLFLRNRGRGEDWRYAAWRKDWGASWPIRSYLQVFMLQGIFLYVIALPLLLVLGGIDHPLRAYDAPGIILFLAGFAFEAVADAQMMRFKRSKHSSGESGRIMDSGLWAWSRHPNYFGEALLWWGLALLALPVGPWYLVLASPVFITFLLLRVSGVPMLERKYAENPSYQEYVNRTPAFIPRPPRRNA